VTAEEWVRLLISLRPPNLREQLKSLGDVDQLEQELEQIISSIEIEPEEG